MNRDSLIGFMVNSIKPWAKVVSGGREVNCRCFYCSDSKNRNKGHMYISTGYNDEPIYFYCQKCKSTGIVKIDTLLEWGIFDSSIAVDITNHNTQTLKMVKNNRFNDNIKYRIINPQPSIDKLSQYKLDYINKRIGSNLSYDHCKQLKICLNLSDIIKVNGLTCTRHENIIKQLDAGFIGFLSIDNAFLNMRNLDIVKDLYSGIDRRYINYNLVNKFSNTKRFYTIPSVINIADPQPLHLHLAEGPFDILSICINLRQEYDRHVYTSIGGSGYLGQLRYFISKLRSPLLNIHLYPDNDVSDYHLITSVGEYLRPFNYPTFIHRNMSEGEKDFGVPRDRIIESVRQIL